MSTKSNVRPFPKKKNDIIDKILEKEGTDEMGLLDLVFVEEILSQKKREQAG